MKNATLILTMFLGSVVCHSQPQLKENFGAAGLGFQNTGSPQTSGWAEYCRRNPDLKVVGMMLPSYSCAATDYFGQATSARVDINTVLVHQSWLVIGSKAGAGAATGPNGVGGSFRVGGWAAANISKILKIDDLFLVASGTWGKDDIAVAQNSASLPYVLKDLASRGIWRFGFGKAW